jgi:hypothetical protein
MCGTARCSWRDVTRSIWPVGTGVDVVQRRRGRLRWLAVALVAVVVVVVAVAMARTGSGGGDPLLDQLATRVVAAMESATEEEHAAHGHNFDHESTIACAAEAFGFEPPEAESVDEVRVIYAHHMCAMHGDGYTWPQSIRAAGPIVVELTDPVTIRTPEMIEASAEMNYADRIRQLIPERYHDQALASESFVDPDVAERLRAEFE